MHYPKTTILIEDEKNDVFQKLWIVGQPDKVLNYIAESKNFDPENRNEERSCRGYSAPKYFETYAEARACAKFWNEKFPSEFVPGHKVPRHGMNCAFKPHLVKICLVD